MLDRGDPCEPCHRNDPTERLDARQGARLLREIPRGSQLVHVQLPPLRHELGAVRGWLPSTGTSRMLGEKSSARSGLGWCHALSVTERGPDLADIDAGIAVAMLADALDDEYELVGPLAGGETGATEVRRADGRRFVLKWELDAENQRSRREGARLAERLRTRARWPAPQQQVVDVGDCLLVIQEFMSGTNVDHISHRLVDRLLGLHDARLGLATPGDQSRWAKDMIMVLVEGGNGYCLHQPLRDFDVGTGRVVERIEEIGRSLEPEELDGHDIVHGDLHPGNLLQVNGHLTAVVDMDYTRVGDATFDLTMLALGSLGVSVDPGVRSRLYERGVHALPGTKRRAYVANLVLRNLDWSIRKNRLAETEFWLTEADRLLPTG